MNVTALQALIKDAEKLAYDLTVALDAAGPDGAKIDKEEWHRIAGDAGKVALDIVAILVR